MSEKPKRRWYQFSLKILLLAITVAAMPLARFAYMKQCFYFHQAKVESYYLAVLLDFHELERLSTQIDNLRKAEAPAEPDLDSARAQMAAAVAKLDLDRKLKRRHQFLADQYRLAMFRPWVIVEEREHP